MRFGGIKSLGKLLAVRVIIGEGEGREVGEMGFW